MGNCCSVIRLRRRSSAVNPKNVTLLLVGLDNAGKTTIAKRLSEEPLDGVLPTVGFSKVSLQEKGCNITVYDLGGGPQIRGIWPQYYPDVHGVIYVIDASDISRLEECKKSLQGLLLNRHISGKPLLLLANKQDVEGALDEIDIVDRLDVERLVNEQKCPTLVELCSAGHFSRKMDVGINNGYKWLLRCIIKDYPLLNNRVLKDVATQEELERVKRIERLERIRRLKEEEDMRKDEPEEKLMNKKPHQNGIIPVVELATLPGQIDDYTPESVPESSSTRNHTRTVSYSCEFFNSEKETPDIVLIKNMDDEHHKRNFFVRPKSSGARIAASKTDPAKKRRKSYHKNNKTAPHPMLDSKPEPEPPTPTVFDTTCLTEVRQIPELNGTVVNESKIHSGKENLLVVPNTNSKSMPNSRKTSANRNQIRTLSTEQIVSKLGKLPPIRVGRASPGRELILDVSKLN